jgi:signal transduction histidine kinase
MQENEIQNNKLQILGKLAASLAHEIRNPLSVIQLNLELLKTADKKEEVDESIDGCLSAAKRIQTLIETTLDFSRTQSTERSPHNLNDIIKSAADILSVKMNAAKIKLSKDLDQALPFININKNKILQVALNLITNSIEAIGSCGEIKIRTYIEKHENSELVVMMVEDNGGGISDDLKEKIFTDFFTNKKNGTGLGLSVCKMILEEHCASISLDSQLGSYTRFFVKFKLSGTI